MRQITRSTLAESDYRAIIEYLLNHSEPAADKFARDLTSRLRMVADQPRMGRVRDDLASGVRSIVVGRYVIFYRHSDDEIIVIRIIHGSRDIPRVFDEAGEA